MLHMHLFVYPNENAQNQPVLNMKWMELYTGIKLK